MFFRLNARSENKVILQIYEQQMGDIRKNVLSENERERIQAEEIYRLNLRRELEANRPRPSFREHLWVLVNSSFALWFLSSVVLALLGTAYNYIQNTREEQIRKLEIRRRLDTEISNRIAQALAGARIDMAKIDQDKTYPPNAYYDTAVKYLDNLHIKSQDNPRDFSIYPEYRDRGFRSLVFELSTIVDHTEIKELREALTVYEHLADLGSLEVHADSEPKDQSHQAVANSMRLLKDGILKPRWVSSLKTCSEEHN